MTDITPSFQGEMQLAGWSESHTGGCKVTFWLPSTDDLQAFRTLTVRKGNMAGHRFMAVLVEIGDDEKPVLQPVTEKQKGGPLAKLAGIFCNDAEFHKWKESTYGYVDAAQCIYRVCEISSRSELDHNSDAAEKFHKYIRGPYSKWRISRGLVSNENY